MKVARESVDRPLNRFVRTKSVNLNMNNYKSKAYL